MNAASSVSRPRVPVVAGGQRVPGLWERVNADGSITYSIQKRVAGKVTRVTLARGISKTEAVKEARALTVGIDSKTIEIGNRRLTLQALVDDFLAFERSPQGSRKASTV